MNKLVILLIKFKCKSKSEKFELCIRQFDQNFEIKILW